MDHFKLKELEAMVMSGVDVNQKGDDDANALMAAVSQIGWSPDGVEKIRLLLAHKADQNQKHQSLTPLEYARQGFIDDGGLVWKEIITLLSTNVTI